MKVAIDAWALATDITDGPVLRPVNRGDHVQAPALSEKVIWQLLQAYAAAVGVPGIAPHDLRRYADSGTMPYKPEGNADCRLVRELERAAWSA